MVVIVIEFIGMQQSKGSEEFCERGAETPHVDREWVVTACTEEKFGGAVRSVKG